MIRVMIVDDHPVVREGFEAMIESTRGFCVVGKAEDGETAVPMVEKVRPDIVVLDIRLPGMDGFATLKRMRRYLPGVKALLLAGMPLREELERAREMDAQGYLPKNVDHRKLMDALAIAASGGPFQEEELPEVPSMLSIREKEVLKFLSIGKTRDEVAVILNVSYETVRTHTKSILVKLDAANTTAAVNRAYELGILRP